jgi:hypothetical protein
MAIFPALFNNGACCLWAAAVVASKTMSKLSFCLSKPSMPSVVVAKPSCRARAKPSESGIMPAISIGRRRALRLSLYMRSVPMLPEPRIATAVRSINLLEIYFITLLR